MTRPAYRYFLPLLAAGLGALAFSARPQAGRRLPASKLQASQARASQAPASYAIDPVHSSVVFSLRHLGVSEFYGRFNRVTGSFHLDEKDPAKSSVSVEIDAASVDTHDAGRDRHLKGPDFFDAKQFPAIRFESRKIRRLAGAGLYEVAGELELHGKKKALSLRMRFVGEGDRGPRFGYRAGFAGTLSLERSDYGMAFMVKQGMLGDRVEVLLGIEGQRKD